MSTVRFGRRVKVQIKDRKRYAFGAADALDGVIGTVTAQRPDGELLVEFDNPSSTWWTHQTRPKAFWFPPSDLADI